MADCLITEIQKFSLQDGPGIRTTIFVKGCPLHCPWCHNPETQNPKHEFYFYERKCAHCGRCVEVCPTGASSMEISNDNSPLVKTDRKKCISCMECVKVCQSKARSIVGIKYDIDEIVRIAVADKPFFKNSGGGVTISGGDPLAFPKFTLQLAKELKKEQVHVAIETSCFAGFYKIRPLIEYVDLFIVDIKTLNPKKHKDIVGIRMNVVLSNIEKLLDSGASVRIHLPIIPGFNDSEDDFNAYINHLGKYAMRIHGVDILAFHVYGENKYNLLGLGAVYAYKGVRDIPPERLVPFAEGLKKAGIKSVTIGGLVGMGGGTLNPAGS